jgi:hypothetical protein
MEINFGELFTITENKKTEDRSLIENVLKCIAKSETQVWAVVVAGHDWQEGKPHCLVISEHDFFRCPEVVVKMINTPLVPVSANEAKA